MTPFFHWSFDCWVSQYRRSFEVVDILWRVRDKYTLVSDASMQPPPWADEFIAPKTGTDKACARREYGRYAGHLPLN
jgi:hypothetical protein